MKPINYKGYSIAESGKATRSVVEVATIKHIQVRLYCIKNGYLLKKTITYKKNDKKQKEEAIASAMKYCDSNPLPKITEENDTRRRRNSGRKGKPKKKQVRGKRRNFI